MGARFRHRVGKPASRNAAVTLQPVGHLAAPSRLRSTRRRSFFADVIARSWKVYAGRSTNKDELQALYERLANAGYAASIQPSVTAGKQVFQVRIAGLLSEADGVAIAVTLRVELGLQDVRVSL